MHRWSALVVSSLLATGAVAVSSPALAAPADLSGRWNSAALRMDGVGYSLRLTAADSDPVNAYTGVLRFHFQDGTLGRRIRVGVVVDGSEVTMVLPGGSLASGSRTLTAELAQDGSMTFTGCQKRLAHVTRRTAPEMCMFQQLPIDRSRTPTSPEATNASVRG